MQMTMEKKLSCDKIISFSDRYMQPHNCSNIKGIKINPEIWSQLNAKKKKTNLKISNLQQVVRKITFGTLKTTNVLNSKSLWSTKNKIMA